MIRTGTIDIVRADLEKTESHQAVVENHRAVPVMDVVDRLRLNLFKVERLHSKLSLALGEVHQIVAKKK